MGKNDNKNSSKNNVKPEAPAADEAKVSSDENVKPEAPAADEVLMFFPQNAFVDDQLFCESGKTRLVAKGSVARWLKRGAQLVE